MSKLAQRNSEPIDAWGVLEHSKWIWKMLPSIDYRAATTKLCPGTRTKECSPDEPRSTLGCYILKVKKYIEVEECERSELFVYQGCMKTDDKQFFALSLPKIYYFCDDFDMLTFTAVKTDAYTDSKTRKLCSDRSESRWRYRSSFHDLVGSRILKEGYWQISKHETLHAVCRWRKHSLQSNQKYWYQHSTCRRSLNFTSLCH